MSELPELGLLMDRDGRADVVFGRAIDGVSTEALHAGVTALADEPDRSAVGRALAQAWSGGFAEATFALARAPTRRLRLSVRPTGEGGLAGVLTHVSSAPTGGVALAQAREALAAAVAERDVAMAENANKSRFLATMSHELRTPLNAIVGFSDIMRLKMFGPLPERYGEYAELIHESGRHLTDLINDVLDMSKIEADRYVLQREAFDARDAVSGAMKLLRLQAEDAGLHLRADLPAAPLRVDADRRALKQIVLNLVSNALKFTPPGGRVDVTLCALDGAMELVVADTGQGVSAEDLARLGKPYEQTDAGRRVQGTGLGLSLVKALTALHGGEFLMESRLGEGSAATVRLPVLTTAAPTPADELAPEPLL
jgi:cell cycle sensor histidine kinase DivJ